MISDNNIIPEIKTDRILIKEMTIEDIDVVYDFNSCADSLAYIVRDVFTSKSEALDKLNYFVSANKSKTALWCTFILKATGEKIGYGGLFDISTEHKRAEIGYGILKKFWNQGYMSEILESILQFGIKELKLHKVYGVVTPGNLASVQKKKKNGFTKEAHLKDHSYGRGRYFDEMIYSLIVNN